MPAHATGCQDSDFPVRDFVIASTLPALMPLNAGTRLGPYQILAPIGAGGMGEVYRASDTRLGREVAVKVLPEHLSESAEVRARFEREAKTIAQLNHPHICQLFDIGQAPGEAGSGTTDYLVMELVDGETLAHRLRRGPLPARELLKIGVEIADALDRAHRAGIVHRDLKPGNIMLTKSGSKLMDFGLARATRMPGGGASGDALTQSPTIAQPLTSEGTIVGTFQYMAPEQLEGREADARSDIWSLGCVLYEMATGRRPFEGRSQASLIAAILEHDPPSISGVRSDPGTGGPVTGSSSAPTSGLMRRAEPPPGLERIVHQCLAKDPDERWQSAGDLRRELEWIAQGSAAGAAAVVPGARPRRKPGWAFVAAAAVLGLGAGALAMLAGPGLRPPVKPPLVRFEIEAPPAMLFNFPAEMALSPDGRTLAFTVSDSEGTNHVCTRALSSPDERLLPGTDHASLPFWSPDSKQIGFFAGGKMQKVALDGTPPVVLCDAPDARGGTWSRDGVILFAPNNQGPIFRVPAGGGQPTAVTRISDARHEFGHRYPQFLPDQRHFLYVAIGKESDHSVFVSSVDGGAPVEVGKSPTGARFAAPDWLLHIDSPITMGAQRLLAQRFDPGSMRASGDAQLLIANAKTANFGYSNVTSDEHGTLVVQHWRLPRFRLDWRSRTGAVIGVAVPELVGTPGPGLSPDSRYLAYCGIEPTDLFVRDLTTNVSRRLTFANRACSNFVWSHDGRRVIYARGVGTAGYEVATKSVDGAGEDSTVFRGPGLFSNPLALSRDDRWLVAQCSDSTGAFDLWVIPMAGQGAPHVYQHTPENENGAAFSPDGKWLAYTALEGAKNALYVQSFPDPGTKYQIAVEDCVGAAWNQKGDRMIVVTSKNEALEIETDLTSGFRQGATRRLFQLAPPTFLVALTQDQQRFLSTSLDLHAISGTLEVVLGWPQLLETK